MPVRYLFAFVLSVCFLASNPWGFYAHKEINYLACFTLPPEMFGFYKTNISTIQELAVRADQRRYAIDAEAPRHYIDLDHYEQIVPIDTVPMYWDSAVAKFGEETLQSYGIVPWHILKVKSWLTYAMKDRDYERIIKLSADLGHYIADAHVPLHTTENYNGQMTDQKGIHGLWESRLPEIFATDYDYFTVRAEYIDHPMQAVWAAVSESFAAKDSVLDLERELTLLMPNTKYSFETRGTTTVKVYSKEFSTAYHIALNNMVERRMKKAIYMVGSMWYTAWVDAGEPSLEFELAQRLNLQDEVDSLQNLMRTSEIKGRMETH
ncbi:MAG TPA: S1/P1 Nuclease [Bacteroidetes bacterium]|nr:S1/P1 Nuclease [Bacteroidota bacterium]